MDHSSSTLKPPPLTFFQNVQLPPTDVQGVPRARNLNCADTANYGECRRKQTPLQIKIADRFDDPRIHSMLGDLASSAMPILEQRAELQGHLVNYPWARGIAQARTMTFH